MPAPKNNQYWKLRKTHGRDRIFNTPDELWDAACEYFQYCDDTKLSKAISRNNSIKINRPYTLVGLCVHIGVSRRYITDLFREKKDFSPVITRIREIILANKIEGSAVGLFHPSVLAWELGHEDKLEESSDTSESGNPGQKINVTLNI